MVVRLDGRSNLECGAIVANIGVFNNLNGSAEYSIGFSKAIATVWRPEEASGTKSKSYLDVIVRPMIGQPQDSHKLLEYNITKILEKIIDFTLFNRCVISLAIQIISEDGPILPVCFNAAVLAILDSGIPIEYVPLGISIAETCNFYRDNNNSSHLILDPNQIEFEKCTTCSTIIVNTNEGNIVSCISNKGSGVSQNKLLDNIHPNTLSIAASKTVIQYISGILLEQIRNKVVRPYNNNLF